MARTITEINASIVSDYVTNMSAIGIVIDPTKWSRRNLQRVIIFTVASAIAIFEQLQDLYYVKQEKQIESAPAGNVAWIQKKIFEFQYSSTNPQIIQLDTTNLSYSYPTSDPSLQIITRCSVTSDAQGVVSVKVAKQEPPTALTNAEVTALNSYILQMGVAGVTYNVTSALPDNIYLGLDLYYDGQYASVILANVIDSINSFFANIPFNGTMTLSALEGAIRTTQGVNDLVLKNIYARPDATAFVGAIKLVSNSTELLRNWRAFAGYMIPETTGGQTPADSINLISE